MNPNQNTQPNQQFNPYSGFSDLSSGQNGNGGISNPAFGYQTSALNTNKDTNIPTPKQSDNSNWFANLLPTIGSIALPTIGALLAPETGGASLLATAALSGLGGAGGQVAENAIKGENPLQSNVFESGLTNTIAGGAGGLLGKIGTKFAANSVAPAAGKVADSLIAGQAGKGQLSTDVANTLRTEYGTTNLNKLKDASQYVTGQDIGIDRGINNIMDTAGKNGLTLDVSSYGRAGSNLPGDAVNVASVTNGLGKGSKAANAVQDYMDNLFQKYNPESITQVPGRNGKIISGFDNGVLNTQSPLAIKQMTSDLGTQADKWMKSRNDTIQAQGRALQQIRNDLTDNLYGVKSGGAIPLTPEDKAAIIKEIAPAQNIDRNFYNSLVDKINNANDVTELRAIQAPIVQANMAAEQGAKIAAQNGGKGLGDILPAGAGVTGFSVGGLPGGVAGYAAGKALESQPAQAAGAKLFSKVSDAVGSKTAEKMIPLLSRIGTVTAANLPTMGAGAVSGEGQPILGDTTMNNGMVTGEQQGGQTDYDQLVKAMVAQSILAPTLAGGSGASSFLASLAPALQKRQTLESSIAGLQNAYNQAGGAQGLGGIGSILSSLVPGTAANNYQQQKDTTAALIANILGTNKGEASNLLPSLLQTAPVANERMGNVNNILSSLAG